jgi:ATP-binding cassette, subfamily C (CFTR/MRP), member 1
VQDIHLKCEPGTLTMVVGAVGSGKSSLLATVFQQIALQHGTVKVSPLTQVQSHLYLSFSLKTAFIVWHAGCIIPVSSENSTFIQVGGSIAYVPQTAWIMNESIRENICMGTPLEEDRREF